MAATDFPVNSPLAVKRWSEELFKEALKKTDALQFIGKDSNSIVQIKTEVNKAAGDKITFGIRQQLRGDGIQGDNTLEGNEESLETYSQSVIIDQLRHAVRSRGKMSEQRVPFSVRNEGRDGLADWWSDRFDRWFFNQLTGNSGLADTRYTGNQAATAPDSDHIVYAGAATADTSLSNTSSMKFTLDLIDRALEKGKLAVNSLRPVMVGSQKVFVCFLHPYQVTDLRTNTNTGQWLDIQKAAMTGGRVSDNPIFNGALGMYNGVLLFENTRIPALTDNAGTQNVRRAILLGAQAGCIAFGRGYGKAVYSWEEELFDYGNQLGIAAGCVGGMVKTRFNGSDFATVAIDTWAAAH